MVLWAIYHLLFVAVLCYCITSAIVDKHSDSQCHMASALSLDGGLMMHRSLFTHKCRVLLAASRRNHDVLINFHFVRPRITVKLHQLLLLVCAIHPPPTLLLMTRLVLGIEASFICSLHIFLPQKLPVCCTFVVFSSAQVCMLQIGRPTCI